MGDIEPNEPQQYILRNPVLLKDIIYNDMGEPPEYLFARSDASEHEVFGVGGDFVKSVFVPVSERVGLVVSQEQADQLEAIFENYKDVIQSYYSGLIRSVDMDYAKTYAVDAVFGVLGVSVEEQK